MSDTTNLFIEMCEKASIGNDYQAYGIPFSTEQLIDMTLAAFIRMTRTYTNKEQWQVEGFNNPGAMKKGEFIADTLQQALLELVMWQKFDKVWDGENWVIERNE